MNFTLPLAFAICSTGFFFLSKLLLLTVHSVLNDEVAESGWIS
jgi:hypothetical protein